MQLSLFFVLNVTNTYACKSALKNHLAIHAKEKVLDENLYSKPTIYKKFSCVKCNYTCDSKRKLNTHNIAHSSENCFTCKTCDFKTLDKFSFYRHHIHLLGDILRYTLEMQYLIATNVMSHSISQRSLI